MNKNIAKSLVWTFFFALAGSQCSPRVCGETSGVEDQSKARTGPCMLASVSADNSVNRGTGSLRSDGQSAAQVLAELQSAIKQECARFSEPHALQRVRLSVGENHIVISGAVPNEADEERLLSIAVGHADGRAVFNNLSLENSTEKLHGQDR